MNVDIHPTTMMLLRQMYEEEELLGVVFGILADLAEMQRVEVKNGENSGHPFMIIKFEEDPIMEPSTDPPKNFRMN